MLLVKDLPRPVNRALREACVWVNCQLGASSLQRNGVKSGRHCHRSKNQATLVKKHPS